MTDRTLKEELSALLDSRRTALSDALKVKGINDRVDSLTLFCRELLRSSSLCLVDGEVFHFTGRCYERVAKAELNAVLGNALIDLGVSPTDVRRMGDMPYSVIGERSFRQTDVLTFDNGTLDIRTRAFSPGFSADRVSVEYLPYSYSPDADCPRWEAFLREVLPDGAVRLVLQEFFGMVFLDRSRLSVEKFAIFVGTGANGKSVVGEVIRRVLGPNGVSSLDTSQLRDPKMLPFVGRRLNFVPDMARWKDFDSSLKALASGQEVTARRNYADPERIKCPPLAFALNDMPLIKDPTDAFFRRVLLFRFGVTIPREKQNRSLAHDIFASDAPGVLNWILEGRDRLLKRRGEFSPCPAMDAAIGALRTETEVSQNPASAYLESVGYQLRPAYPGQPPVLVSQNEIVSGLRNTVTRYAVTAELRSRGVDTFRSKELFYKVYPKSK